MKIKKEQNIFRILGFIFIPLGYAIFIPCVLLGSPLCVLGMFMAVAGIIMLVRSFVHVKYHKLDERIKNTSNVSFVDSKLTDEDIQLINKYLPVQPTTVDPAKLAYIPYKDASASRGTKPAEPIQIDPAKLATIPVFFDGTDVHIKSDDFFRWRNKHSTLQYEIRKTLPLTEKEPKIRIIEDDVCSRTYVLQTEGDEDFTGKYFHISVRLGVHGNPPLPVTQIDGFISDTPEDDTFSIFSNHIGYRMEGQFLLCGGETGKRMYEKTRGQDLPMKALKYPGYTTPTSVRLLGICPDCGKSFAFHGYAFYMAQCDVAYSDDGLDCCQIFAYNIDKDTWSTEIEGKTFRYYNTFNCPHCGTPYIDYKTYPENKVFGVSGCVHLGRKAYKAEE